MKEQQHIFTNKMLRNLLVPVIFEQGVGRWEQAARPGAERKPEKTMQEATIAALSLHSTE